MTGGTVVVLGATGRNFAAGMSGGVAYVYDPHGRFPDNVNYELVDLEPVDETSEAELRTIIERHQHFTGSTVAERILTLWTVEIGHFRKVMPRDYKRVMDVLASGLALVVLAPVANNGSAFAGLTAKGWLLMEGSGNPFLLAANFALLTLPTLLVSGPAGVLTDRLGSERVLIRAQWALLAAAGTQAAAQRPAP